MPSRKGRFASGDKPFFLKTQYIVFYYNIDVLGFITPCSVILTKMFER